MPSLPGSGRRELDFHVAGITGAGARSPEPEGTLVASGNVAINAGDEGRVEAGVGLAFLRVEGNVEELIEFSRSCLLYTSDAADE